MAALSELCGTLRLCANHNPKFYGLEVMVPRKDAKYRKARKSQPKR